MRNFILAPSIVCGIPCSALFPFAMALANFKCSRTDSPVASSTVIQSCLWSGGASNHPVAAQIVWILKPCSFGLWPGPE